MKDRQKIAHMNAAVVYGSLSYAARKKVGCIIVDKDGERVMSIGYNGTPAGWDNRCEEDVTVELTDLKQIKPLIDATPQHERDDWSFSYYDHDKNGVPARIVAKRQITSEHVSHAEHNAICKLAKGPGNGKDAYLFVTLSPCVPCAKMIADSGISHVIYKEKYQGTDGISYLQERGVKIEQLEKQEGEQEWNQIVLAQSLKDLIKK